IPFLLFNLSIRGISGIVFHGDTLKGKYKAVYVLTNERNSPIVFSIVTKWN
ncbi:SAM-dependent DNA methyltransferase, partial [Parabacteroides sp. AF48-14]